MATSNWTLPGKLVSSFTTASDRLAIRTAGVHPTFPKTKDGNFVVFDGATGLNASYNHAPNQGFHLGAPVHEPPTPPFSCNRAPCCHTANSEFCCLVAPTEGSRVRPRPQWV